MMKAMKPDSPTKLKTTTIELRDCRCGGHAQVDPDLRKNEVLITCSKWGCKQVTAKTVEEAAAIWNEPDFRDAA
jgi:hypothetical protein